MARKKLSDYMQTQVYGEWLERYLNPALTYRELEELIFDAVKLIHLNYGPLTSDKLLVALRNKEPDTPILPDLEALVNDALSAKGVSYSPSDVENERIKNVLDEIARVCEYDTDTSVETGIVLYNIALSREASLAVLQEILKARVPLVDYLMDVAKDIFGRFAHWHSFIVDIVEIGGDAFRLRRAVVRHEKKLPDIFPLHLIFARIFVDFLLLGGWNYYGFCKHCGRFFLIQRKGRKQFCSDPCRFQFHHPAKNIQR